jgi:hypothetical protein
MVALPDVGTVPAVSVPAIGEVVSIISALFAPIDPAEPGDAKVNTASFAVESFMVPPFSVRALVDR